MPEQFDIAAIRHMKAGEILENAKMGDDAGYHFGVSAENAVKNAMREAGLEAHWTSSATTLKKSPMRGHWGVLQNKLHEHSAEISVFASGRRATPLVNLSMCLPSGYFQSWGIDIRYADQNYVPVSSVNIASWKAQAARFIADFVL